MKTDERSLLGELLHRQRVLSLSVIIEDRPYVGLLAFAMHPSRKGVLVHASKLARHSRGLVPGAAFGALVRDADGPEIDPLQIPRFSFQGQVLRLDSGDSDYLAAQERYTARFPSSKQLFSFGDFHLYHLQMESGRFVAGFGRISTVTPQDLLDLEPGA